MLLANVTHAICNTPLLDMTPYAPTGASILAKWERLNPLGSIKDRTALYMIDDAEQSGRLLPNATIVEPTSGNTGIGLAFIAATRGYKLILTMPESMSAERRSLLAALGAKLVLTPAAQGMPGAIAQAQEILVKTPGAVMMGQFDNPANAEAHRLTTGPEIWRDAEGRIDAFVAGVGTGGTITGVAMAFKPLGDVHIVAVEPAESPVLSGGTAGAHGIQGIGAGFVPGVLHRELIDEVLTISTQEALEAARALNRHGLFVGISSGANWVGALRVAARPEMSGKTVVTVFPDTAERYLSTDLFADGMMPKA